MPAPAPPPVPGPPPGSSKPAPETTSAGAAERRRIGLYGGSFDPVHAGHLHAARAALAAFDLERVVFVPAARSPHKLARELASGADRLAMLALAIAGEPRFAISDLELARGGPSYTIDTVRALPQVLGDPEAELHLILGSDTLPDFPRWREAAELVRRTQPIVVHREGDPRTRLAEIERALGPEARRKFERGYLRLAPVDVSSTELRAPAGLDTGGEKLPRAVLDYIETRGLYGRRRAAGTSEGPACT